MTASPSVRRASGAANVALSALALLALAGAPLRAQVEAEPVLRGTVRLGDADVTRPPAGIERETVVLHRVGQDTAGAVDSMRVGPDGSFSFRLPTVPDPGGRGEVYFASVEHHGIMYFGGAISAAVQLDSLYVIAVHDTTAAPSGGATLPVAIRYMVLEPATAPEGAPPDQGGGWRMTDLIQVRNDGARTLVAVDSGPVWTHPLPAGGSRFQVGGGDFAPDAAGIHEGRLVVRAPLPPGERQFILRYALDGPEVTIPLAGTTESLELLVREPAPPLRVEGLEREQPVEMEAGTTYRRYVGTGLSGGQVRVERGEERGGGASFSPRWLAVILALLLGGVGVWAATRPRPRTADGDAAPADGPGPAPGPDTHREALLLEVARIDEALEEGDLDPAEADRLRARRAELVERLATRG